MLALAVLVALAMLFALPSRRVRHHLTCLQNLGQLGLSIADFAQDHAKRTSWEISTNDGGTLEYCLSGEQTFRHFQLQSNYITAWVVVLCPQDDRVAATNWESLSNANVSYFVGLDSRPSSGASIMAGDRNITASEGIILRANNHTPPRWVKRVGLHGDKGHILFGDGHVEVLDSSGLSNALQRTRVPTHRLAVP